MRLPSDTLELIELDKRAREFLNLEVHDYQKSLVSTVAQSYADALFPPDYDNGPPVAWMRGILRNTLPAGFVMCANPTEQQKDPWIWRLLVDKSHQGFGGGKFAVEAAIKRYREMDCQRVLVAWVPHDGNASLFYKKLGFTETGEYIDGEIVAEFVL